MMVIHIILIIDISMGEKLKKDKKKKQEIKEKFWFTRTHVMTALNSIVYKVL